MCTKLTPWGVLFVIVVKQTQIFKRIITTNKLVVVKFIKVCEKDPQQVNAVILICIVS